MYFYLFCLSKTDDYCYSFFVFFRFFNLFILLFLWLCVCGVCVWCVCVCVCACVRVCGAAPGDVILEGTVRKIVVAVCEEHNIKLQYCMPNINDIKNWQGCFIT